MVFKLDPATTAALQGNPEISIRVQVITPTRVLTIPVLEDQSAVSYDVSSMQVRNASLTVNRAVTDAGLLNPLTDQVFINMNISGGFDVPLFYGRVQKQSEVDVGRVTVTCIDHGDDLAGDQFHVPWATRTDTVGDEIKMIVQNTDATFNVDYSLVPTEMLQPVPTLTWDADAAKAVDDLARSVLCMWRSKRGGGGFEFYPNPFASQVYTTVATFSEGDNGTIITMQSAKTRENVYNSITVIVERTDGSDPIRVTVFDNDPTSLTYFYGPFGQRNKNYTIQSAATQQIAYILAVRLLQASLALSQTWTWSVPCQPNLDPGDIVIMDYRNVVSPVMIETIAIPLSAAQPTQFTGKKLILIDPGVIGLM